MDIQDQRFQDGGLAMQERQVQRGLPGMTGPLAHRRQQQRTTRDGLHTRAGVGSSAVTTPTVVRQCTGRHRGLAAVDAVAHQDFHAAGPPVGEQVAAT